MKRLSKSEAMADPTPAPNLSTLFDQVIDETDGHKGTSFLQSPFKVPRKDAKGQSGHINFYTAPYYIRIAQELQSKVADFQTLSDVYSCAMHYGLKHLQDIEGVGETSVQAQLNVWMEICQQAEMDEDLELAMDKMRETVNRKVAAGAVEEAKRTVAMTRHATEQMPDGYYKQKALAFLGSEFGRLWGGQIESKGGGEGMNGNGSGGGSGVIPMEVKK